MLAAERASGIIVLVGRPGGGKTAALRHLLATLPPEAGVRVFDSDRAAEALKAGAAGLVVLAACEPPAARVDIADVLALDAWTLDDCMEYLAARHREQCAPLLVRWSDDAIDFLGGSRELLSIVMDAMAADASSGDPLEVLRRHVEKIFPTGDLLQRLIDKGAANADLSPEQRSLWRHVAVQKMCLGNWIADRLAAAMVPQQLYKMAVYVDAVGAIALAVRRRPAAVRRLNRLLRNAGSSSAAAMAASILLAIDPEWRPSDGRRLNLQHARLDNARWARLDLSESRISDAQLAGADLSGSDLSKVTAVGVNLFGAKLCGARLEHADFSRADLGSANLSNARATAAVLSGANLRRAVLSHASLRGSRFVDTELTEADCEAADFDHALLHVTNVEESTFAGANLKDARLERVRLDQARWDGARFPGVWMRHCNLEGLELVAPDFSKADLTGCLLTGSCMPRACFRGANLSECGLAEVDWENADLRSADLTRASFHLGSTRSGLVGSTIPCEGSRTGFYTDEYNEQPYKVPEEIRKACLCGANLAGAKVAGTDFYLVDLRRATYSPDQARHFARTGAILRSAHA